MQEHYQDPERTMNSLAEHLQMSAVSLSIEFKNEMKVNPSEYLANLRMDKAKGLLLNTDMLIKDNGDHDYSSVLGYGLYDVLPAESSVEAMSRYDWLIFTGPEYIRCIKFL